jgi:SAM-dependent methyltransferase
VAAFAALAHTVAGRSTRVVDVGSGHGHLTRHLARALTLDAVGWERDPARVAVATRRTHDDTVRFVAVDAATLTDTLGPRDLVVALHACGALGDLAACAAAEVGAPVALVGCCLQKREGDRAPLVAPPGIDARALTLARRVLGLGNVCDGDEGVEADLATRVRARVQRDALRTLLREAGVALVQGEEMRGLNRRRATGDFEALVTAAFGARGLAAPPATHATAALATQWIAHARLRRWTLPRTMLGRVVEVWVAHDRAALLRQRGYDARVVAAFEATWSARNVAVLGAPRRAHA